MCVCVVGIDLLHSYRPRVCVCCRHRPLRIRTDGSHARVCELGSIGVFGFYCNFVKSGPFVTKFGTHCAADMH